MMGTEPLETLPHSLCGAGEPNYSGLFLGSVQSLSGVMSSP